MSGIEAFFGLIATWFGFVGSCIAGEGTACRPFLAFVALAAAAVCALALVLLTYRTLQRAEIRDGDARRNAPLTS